MTDFNLTNRQKRALRRAVLAGDYHLMLGAGASRDSVSPDGTRLPGSGELAEELSREFKVPLEERDELWRVYARAVEVAGKDAVYLWLRGRFWGVTPPAWLDTYARTPWSCVWTLNIDDSFETSYARIQSPESRSLSTTSWDDEFRLGQSLPVVHLHGCVDRDDPRDLVFSLSEYHSTAVGRAAWPINFRDVYGVSPFVIIGARLRDEPDIEAVVANRSPTHDAPSFYVSRTISPATEQDLRRWNLIPVQMTGERFASVWRDLTGLALDQAPTPRAEIALRIGRQFRELHLGSGGRRPQGHDFIGGDQPIWHDIQQSRYAELDWIRQACADVRQLGDSVPASSVIVYVGERLTGRSAGLLAVGRELRARSWRTFLFVGDERPDVEAVLRFASNGRPVALLFDGISDIADDISDLIHHSRNADLEVAIVGVDHVGRTASIVGRIENVYLVHRRIGTIGSRLSTTDSRRLVDKLDSLGRLGVLEAERRDQRRVAHFRNKELFDSMARLENAPAFGRRIGELVESLESNLQMKILLLAALASRVDRRFRVIDAGRMAGIESEQVVRMARDDDRFGAIIWTDGQWVRTRHRWLALEPTVRRLGEPEALSTLGQALSRSAPRLGLASNRARNATALLVGSFMSYDNLVQLFPAADLDTWYESLQPTYGAWSARYWEQRAIMCRRLGRIRAEMLAKAESFALRAVSIVRDSYSLTTLATVLLAKAATVSTADVETYYDRAYEACIAAGDQDPSNFVTWLAFLRYSLEVLSRGSERMHGERSLPSVFFDRVNEDWVRVSTNIAAIAGGSESTLEQLRDLRRRHSAVTRGQ